MAMGKRLRFVLPVIIAHQMGKLIRYHIMDLTRIIGTGMAMLMLTELQSRNGLREKRISRSRNGGNLYG